MVKERIYSIIYNIPKDVYVPSMQNKTKITPPDLPQKIQCYTLLLQVVEIFIILNAAITVFYISSITHLGVCVCVIIIIIINGLILIYFIVIVAAC